MSVSILKDPIGWLFQTTFLGIPLAYFVGFIALIIIIMYLIATRTSKPKEFKPLDLKKETKRRFKNEYKHFGKSLNKNMFDANDNPETNNKAKPIAFAIGYMKVVEMKEMKRLEPIYTSLPKDQLIQKHERTAQEIYSKAYSDLNEIEKKNIDEVSKEELRNERIEDIPVDEKVIIKRGRKETKYSEPIPMFMFKICSPDLFSKIGAFFGMGIDWFLLNKEQVSFNDNWLALTSNFQRRTPFDIFTFSPSGTKRIEDISFGIERENIWQETANQIPRAVHFDIEASKALIYRREEARIEKEKRKAQTESHEMG